MTPLRKRTRKSKLPKEHHSYLLDHFEKGYCYIYCGKCEKMTLHEPLKKKKDRMVAKIDGKVVAFKIKFRCKECGHIVTFREKKL